MKKIFTILALVTLFMSCSNYGEKLEFDGTEVYYTKGIEKAEATKLGQYLISSKFADGRKKSVQLTKDEETNRYNFRMVTAEKAAKDSTYNFIFKLMARQISDSVFDGKPVDFHVCDNTFNTLKVLSYDTK